MEVHHHGHVHHQSKWKEYLFQFLMLFLAVTLGFVVENLREHYIERQRAKQYGILLLNDLVSDSTVLTERNNFVDLAILKLDTMVTLLRAEKHDSDFVEKIYELSAYAYSGAFFGATTATMTQLKASGNLRYFENVKLISDFSLYDTEVDNTKTVVDRNLYVDEGIRTYMSQFLDLRLITRLSVQKAGVIVIRPERNRNLQFQKSSKEDLLTYANWCSLKKLEWYSKVNSQRRLMVSLRGLITSLKETFEV
jgi:hypothetical protein